tara:strand:- start:14925 stop:15923 length:999 start_codon:yes stop_codon:yes gene_type:complete
MKILGIETSCDETGVAVFDSSSNLIIAEELYSQVMKHSKFGGVVPELASRDHVEKLLPLLSKMFKDSKLDPLDLDGIAFTAGPGLRGPLLAGASLAKSLAFGWNLPCLGIHHMEAHLLVNCIENPAPKFPFLTLLVSGGHCLLIVCESLGSYKVIGQTRDDAVGEAFDKVSKLLGLGYPGGPAIETLSRSGDPIIALPRPMLNSHDYDFSFSGLKTAVFYAVKKQEQLDKEFKQNIASSFQEAVFDVLITKIRRALKETKLNQLVIGGGVASNERLRERLKEEIDNTKVFFPALSRCTDNGAMVAVAGSFYLNSSIQDYNQEIKPKWSLSDL